MEEDKPMNHDTQQLLRECSAGIDMAVRAIDDVAGQAKDAQMQNALLTCRKAHQALEKHEGKLKKYGPPALFVVVCIPLTGVGCWIGSTLARLTDMDEKRAGLAILGGTLVSGLITILGVYGLIGGIQYLLK